MTAAALTLTDFLLARIAEDEATARYELGDLMADRPDVYSALGGADPARVLAECEAKRRIVDAACLDVWEGHPLSDSALMALAAVYADHPDFDESWRP